MTREELLSLASQWRFSQTRTRVLAARMTTSEAVACERARVSALSDKYSRKVSSSGTVLWTGVVIGILGLVAVILRDYLPFAVASIGAIATACGIGLFIGGDGLACVAGDNLSEAQATLADLNPVVHYAKCKTALELVDGGQPAVLAWRDLAIAERGVLCAFDVQIMRELHYASKAAAEAATAQRENERACRRLYGIADHDALPAELVKAGR